MQRVIDFFLSPAAASEAPGVSEKTERPGGTLRAEDRRVVVSSHRDPSYVFFRQIPHTDSGPPGALGVALTPDASLAVDPRVTPLGAPVFIAAGRPSSTVTVRRLMVAQDTGGAMRGALRADYFLGFGPAAAASAMRMKEELRMWVLLPKDLAIASRHLEPGGVGHAPHIGRASCLLADSEFCAEEDAFLSNAKGVAK